MQIFVVSHHDYKPTLIQLFSSAFKSFKAPKLKQKVNLPKHKVFCERIISVVVDCLYHIITAFSPVS